MAISCKVVGATLVVARIVELRFSGAHDGLRYINSVVQIG